MNGDQPDTSNKSADHVTTDEGRQYHIGLNSEEVEPFILFCGDPARARKIASRFDHVRVEQSNREYLTLTGSYHDIPLSVMATGMGPDNMEIAVVELLQLVDDPTFLRIGSCGSLQEQISLGDIVISTGAVRLENTSLYFVHEGYPCLAHHETIMALMQAADDLNLPYHSGLTATGSGFYGAQSREMDQFPLSEPDLHERLQEMDVANFEMESSTLFTLSSLQNVRSGTVCGVFANRPDNEFVGDQQKKETEEKAIQCGLKAVEYLTAMDEKKEQHECDHWLPSFGL